ncbi:MAG: EthD family reductase [Ilumatobacteraceae bacterium]|nr:EthD family reductase [Ilumatobacteraceae bacterium]
MTIVLKAIILLARRTDMTAEAFHAWWLDEHAPLAAQLPAVRKIVFNVIEDADEYDGVSELWFDDREAFDAAYASEIGQRVAADSMAHVRGRTRLFVVEHSVVDDTADNSASA